MRRSHLPLSLAFLLLGALPAAAQESPAAQPLDPVAEYRSCLALALERPEAALEAAGRFEGLGGGVPARHCRAAAWAAMGKNEAAAGLLEDLAQEGRATADVKAGLLRQAARAWMDAGQTDRARGVLDAALKVTPGAPALLEDRALLRAGQNDLWGAVDDLNAALEAQPDRLTALVLRAAAYRRLETLDLAQVDLERAASLAPDNLDIKLEQGHLALAHGDEATARQMWMTILRTAPDSPVAVSAQQALEQMEMRR